MNHPSSTHSASHLLLLLLMLPFLAWGCSSSESVSEETPSEQEVEIPLEGPAPDRQFDLDTKQEDPADRLSIMDPDSVMKRMNLREKIGQLFVIPAYGVFQNAHNRQFLELKRLVSRYRVGGIIFMSGDIYGQAMMTDKLQQISSLPLWVSQDMEYGAAMRVRGTTRFPPAMGVAATGNPQNAYIKGQITAREARALGVNQIYAPVLDVNNNPDNPVINVRSYSADPVTVSVYGEAFRRGVEQEGLLATAKHFPGHGDTDVDSHLALPVVRHDFARIDSVELQPFRHSIENGLKSVMSAHIAFPALGEDQARPGTLDPFILRTILRDSLGFEGLIVTDGLEMNGISSNYSPGEAVVQSLQAGADVMLISPDVRTAMHEVEQAVERGQLTEERIDLSVRKVLQLKIEHGLFYGDVSDFRSLDDKIRTPNYQAAADRIARESVTVTRNRNRILPIRESNWPQITIIAVADDASGSTGSRLASEIRKYHSRVRFHVLDQRTGVEEKQEMLESAKQSDLLIIGSFIYVRSHQPMQLTDDQIVFLRHLEQLDSPSVLISFGNPYVLRDLDGSDAQVLAWSASDAQIRNTVPALFGGAAVAGKLPIDIPDRYDFGEGLDLPHSALRQDTPESVGFSTDSLMILDDIMQKAIEDSVFPGGVITVVKDGVIAWERGYGYHDYTRTRPVRSTDVYDLASITKVMATSTAIMKLYEEGKIHLEDPVANYIDEYQAGEKREVTLRDLLLHTSGLPAFKTYVDTMTERADILKAVRNEPLEYPPGTRYLYSDLGFILLGEIVEKVSGHRLDRYVRRNFFTPMDLHSAHFNPDSRGEWMVRRIPPTEIDTVYNRGLVQAGVHDERAWFMEGVAGHAGLFASGTDIAKWSQLLHNKGYYAGRRYLSPETVELFTGHRSPINQRGYGFDRKSEGFSSAGSFTSMNTFGHLGFTGTSVWIDPDAGVTVILLTNRTFPDRSRGSGIRQIRPAVADAVMNALRPERTESAQKTRF